MSLLNKAVKFTCPRRYQDGTATDDSPFVGAGPGRDTYRSGHGLVNQRRGCSYCGSMPPEDLFAAIAAGLQVVPTDKSYKLYVDGDAGKFYTHHLSPEQGWEFDRLYRAGEINWGYPGRPYVPLYVPGPSTDPRPDETRPVQSSE